MYYYFIIISIIIIIVIIIIKGKRGSYPGPRFLEGLRACLNFVLTKLN